MGEELRKFIDSRVKLSDEEWTALEGILKVKHLRKKEHFLLQGEVCRNLGFVGQGYLRLYFLREGEEITKDFNFENSFCGSYASFSLKQPSRFNVVAMEDTKLYLIPGEGFYELMEKYNGLQKMVRVNLEYMFIKKEQREASFLLDSAEERYQELLKQYPGIEQRVPLKYLASYLGITPETLSRIRRY